MRDDALYEKLRRAVGDHADETGRSLKDMEEAVHLFYTAFEDGVSLSGEETIREVINEKIVAETSKLSLGGIIITALTLITGFLLGFLF